MSDAKRSKGWGSRQKEERTRQQTNEKLKAQPPDVNDAFKFKPVKQPKPASASGTPATPTTPSTDASDNSGAGAAAAVASPQGDATRKVWSCSATSCTASYLTSSSL